MASGFFATIFRFLIFLVNFAFFIFGGIMFGAGISMHQNKSTEVVFQHDYTAISVIVLGGLIFIVAFFGCCGAFKEDSCMLRTYAILVLILLILQVCLVVLVYKKPEAMEKEFKKQIENAVTNYYTEKKYQDFVDDIQNSTICCGFKGPQDYLDHKEDIPATCCKVDNLDNGKCSVDKANKEGCYDALVNTVKENINLLKWVVISVLGFQALSILISFCLASNIRRAYDVV